MELKYKWIILKIEKLMLLIVLNGIEIAESEEYSVD